MKKYNKKKIIILTATLFIYIPLVFAAISYSSSDVVVDNTNTSLGSVYLQDAIDEIDYVCSTNHPNNYSCVSNTPKCIRATTLHTETCTVNNISYCLGAGYELNDTITYGNQTTTPGTLIYGDPFDCDVNGDGVYDAATERFYYISDYYDTDKKMYNDKIAVLIYYSNTTGGVPSTSNAAYDCSSSNRYGPVTAMQNLPTTTQWSNIRLYNESRRILTETSQRSTAGGSITGLFSYSGYAARLLTNQELVRNCSYLSNTPSSTYALDTCIFLFERTKFASTDTSTPGWWLETPCSSRSESAYYVYSIGRVRHFNTTSSLSYGGVRPAIDVLKSEISY